MYVVGRGDCSAADMERMFHAELSRIPLRNFRRGFAEEAWRKINPPEFRYLGSGVQVVRAGQASHRPRAAPYEAGFLTQYAQASIEEDFNSIAARRLMGDDALRRGRASSAAPGQSRTGDRVLRPLDPGFARDYFRALGAATENERGF